MTDPPIQSRIDEPGSGPISPCLKFNCSLCCHDTEMTLSNEDIERIMKNEYSGFYVKVDDFLCLKNVEGRCFFLKKGVCSIYGYRPLGCTVYPVIFDLDENRAIMDDFCPHTDHFIMEPWHHECLAEAVSTEDRERETRRRVGSP